MRFSKFLSESINDKGILKAVFFAGSPGAGKGYVLKQINSGDIQPRIVNTDKPYEFLVHAYGGTFTGQEDEFVDRATVLTEAQLFQYVNGFLPLFIDGTSSNTDNTIARANILKQLGYDVAMVFVQTDLETALDRASKRERVVPPEFIEKAYERLMRNKSKLRSHFSTFFEYDNTSDQIDDEALNQLFKRSYRFFSTPLQNARGIEIIKRARATDQKYLTPGIMKEATVKSLLSGWYS
jgi:dephospho-CoA kinase